jgi:exosortase A
MSATQAASTVPLAEIWRGLRGSAIALGIGLLLLGGVFYQEVAIAVRIWESSTAYNHCFLIIPIVIYLIWDRRDTLAGISAVPVPWVMLAAIPVAIGWLVAERLGIMEGRQLMVVSFAQVMFLAVLGWRLWWALLGPLLYLYFLVPFGEFLTPKLQDITAVFIRHGVVVLNIPAYVDGYTIEIPEGTFYVAEACAGLRFLIASIAFGVLYALLVYRSPIRRGAFILISIVVPIIANGFRALGIVALGHYLGSADAAAADHVLYGWLFFSIVILLLIAIGMPFRQDEMPPVSLTPSSARTPSRLLPSIAAGLGVCLIAGVSAGTAAGLDQAGTPPVLAAIPIDPGAACVVEPATTADPDRGSGRMVAQRLLCGASRFDLRLITFSPRSTAGPVLAERRRLTRPAGAEEVTEAPFSRLDDSPTAWRVMLASHPNGVAAAALWIGGDATGPGFATRLRLAQASLLGSRQSAFLAVIKPVYEGDDMSPQERRQLERDLVGFLTDHPDLERQLRDLSAAVAR